MPLSKPLANPGSEAVPEGSFKPFISCKCSSCHKPGSEHPRVKKLLTGGVSSLIKNLNIHIFALESYKEKAANFPVQTETARHLPTQLPQHRVPLKNNKERADSKLQVTVKVNP